MKRAPRNSYEASRIAELIEQGLRSVKPHKCRHCAAQCLRGEDADVASMIAIVDAEPIDQLDEVIALLDGRFTYDITKARGKAKANAFVLHRREPWHYHSATRKHPVLVEHKCQSS